jgi:hypothetical protein
MTGQKKLLPSLSGGDVLPGLVSGGQADQAQFGFNVRYNQSGEIHKNSDFQVKYETGKGCGKPSQAASCHIFELDAISIAWLTTQGENDSTGIFQGTAKLNIDGQTANVVFRLAGLDGQLLDNASEDYLTLKIYPEGANLAIDAPLYQVSAEVPRGNIKVGRW